MWMHETAFCLHGLNLQNDLCHTILLSFACIYAAVKDVTAACVDTLHLPFNLPITFVISWNKKVTLAKPVFYKAVLIAVVYISAL